MEHADVFPEVAASNHQTTTRARHTNASTHALPTNSGMNTLVTRQGALGREGLATTNLGTQPTIAMVNGGQVTRQVGGRSSHMLTTSLTARMANASSSMHDRVRLQAALRPRRMITLNPRTRPQHIEMDSADVGLHGGLGPELAQAPRANNTRGGHSRGMT